MKILGLVVLPTLAVLSFSGLAGAADAQLPPVIELKLSLPNGAVYRRGATDPVEGLIANLQLVNVSKPYNRTPVEVKIRTVRQLTPEEEFKLASDPTLLTADEAELERRAAELRSEETVKEMPTNPDSFGIAYAPPKFGTHELVTATIFPVPEEGEAAAEGATAKPLPIKRNMSIEYTAQSDAAPSAYLAPGATSPAYPLAVGKFYKIPAPGLYRMTVSMPGFADPKNLLKRIESNPVTFRVLPYKAVNRKIEELKRDWTEFERDELNFDYMFYELPTDQPYRVIYYVRAIKARELKRWEWSQLCSVARDGAVQIEQLTSKKVAVLAPHDGGFAGLFMVDFTTLDPTVTTKRLPLKPGREWKLQVENGVPSAVPSDGGATVRLAADEEPNEKPAVEPAENVAQPAEDDPE
jgi:hypothetical protein